MTILLIGVALLAFVLSLFYLKDQMNSRLLGRIAHSELMMRFAVIAGAMIFIGGLLVLDKMFG